MNWPLLTLAYYIKDRYLANTNFNIIITNLQWNELNRGHPTFFYQSQDEFRTKESEFVHFGLISNEGLAVESSFPSTKRHLNIYWKAPRKTLGGPGWVRYTVNGFNLTILFFFLEDWAQCLCLSDWNQVRLKYPCSVAVWSKALV